MTAPIKYFNIWDVLSNQWVNSRRRISRRYERQNPNKPWLLTYDQVVAWIDNDWGGQGALGSGFIIKEMSPREVEYAQREAHADKYL